jgi:hypothetical protein
MTAAILLALLLQDKPEPDPIAKERTSLLRHSLKPHAAFLGVDKDGRVRLRLENDPQEKEWALDPEAEVRVHGTWGAASDLVVGERIWAWVRVDRKDQPRAVFMIADEISEQDIHQVPYSVASADPAARTIVVKRKLDGKTEQSRTLRVAASLAMPKEGAELYLQTAGEELVRTATAETLTALKREQTAKLEKRWRNSGLPGTVTGLHLLTGEIEVTLDHEAIRWARSLKAGDKVDLNLGKEVEASVIEIRPWYERTRVTMAAIGRDLSDVTVGRRLHLTIDAPSAEALRSPIPLDAGRPRDPAARAEWMLASTYCGCSIHGDVCTGMFYTLAACNTMTCNMPNQVRKFVRPLMEKGMSDAEIFERMEKEFGASIWKPHLLR